MLQQGKTIVGSPHFGTDPFLAKWQQGGHGQLPGLVVARTTFWVLFRNAQKGSLGHCCMHFFLPPLLLSLLLSLPSFTIKLAAAWVDIKQLFCSWCVCCLESIVFTHTHGTFRDLSDVFLLMQHHRSWPRTIASHSQTIKLCNFTIPTLCFCTCNKIIHFLLFLWDVSSCRCITMLQTVCHWHLCLTHWQLSHALVSKLCSPAFVPQFPMNWQWGGKVAVVVNTGMHAWSVFKHLLLPCPLFMHQEHLFARKHTWTTSLAKQWLTFLLVLMLHGIASY